MAESTGPEGAGVPGAGLEVTGLGGIGSEGAGLDGRERDLAPVGALVGHPARAAMLAALADGRALPATDLARYELTEKLCAFGPGPASYDLAVITTRVRAARRRYAA